MGGSTAFSRWRPALRAGLPLLLIAILTGCGMIPPEPETETAKDVFGLYIIVFAMGLAVFIGVEAFIIYAVFRYRRRDDRLPDQLHGNNVVEILWTAIPTVIVLVLFVLSMFTLGRLDAKAANPPVNIEVTGFQWQWQFHYLDGDGNPDNDYTVVGSTAAPPMMVVPVGETIHLSLSSADVIHSFFVPHFLIKRDVFPLSGDQKPNELEFSVIRGRHLLRAVRRVLRRPARPHDLQRRGHGARRLRRLARRRKGRGDAGAVGGARRDGPRPDGRSARPSTSTS